MREFHLGDILSVTTGRLVSPSVPPIDGVYAILNYMTDESLFTHQLPRVCEEAAPVLLDQHPQLAAVDASGVGRDNWREWLAEQVATYGERLPVEPMTADEHERIDPISEAAEKVHPSRIIVVDPNG